MALLRPTPEYRSAESKTADMAGSFLISEPMLLSIRKLSGSRTCKEHSRLESRERNRISMRRLLSERRDGSQHEQGSIHWVGRNGFAHGR